MRSSAAPGPLTVLRGHEGAVQCVEWINNKTVASGDIQGNVKFWSTQELRPFFEARLHDPLAGLLSLQHVEGLAGGDLLLSAGRDGVVKAWQIEGSGGLSRQPLLEVQSGVFSFCRPHSLVTLPLTSVQEQQQQQQLQQQEQQQQPEGDNESMHATRQAMQNISISTDARQQSSVMQSVMGGVTTGTPVPAPKAPGSTPSLQPLPNLATASQGTLQPGVAVAGHAWYLACAGSNAGEVRVWDLRAAASSCMTLKRGTTATSLGMCMAVHVMGGGTSAIQVLSGFEDGSLAVWDPRKPDSPLAVSERGHSDPVMCLAVRPDGREAVSGSAGDELCFWSLSAACGHPEAVSDPSASTSPACGVAPGLPSPAAVSSCDCSGSSSCSLSKIRGVKLPQPGVADVAFRPDGRIMASAGWDGKVRFFSARKKKALAVLRYHQKEVTCVRFEPLSPESGGTGLFATSSRDHTVALWSLYGDGDADGLPGL